MTETGMRWKREIALPQFGQSERYLAVQYCGETRYVRSPERWCDETVTDWMKPLYAVRVTARSI
jgi:hypothetical protein